MPPMTEHEVVERAAAQPSASRSVGFAGGAAVRIGGPAASGCRPLDSTTLPTCEGTDEDVDDCHCVDLRDWDERDEDDLRRKCELEGE